MQPLVTLMQTLLHGLTKLLRALVILALTLMGGCGGKPAHGQVTLMVENILQLEPCDTVALEVALCRLEDIAIIMLNKEE